MTKAINDGREHRRGSRRLGLPLSAQDVRWLAEYRIHMERRNVRPRSIDKLEGTLRLFAESIFPREFITATHEDVDRFLDGRHLGARGRYAYISTLHGFYKWAVIYGKTKVDPTLKVMRPRLPRQVPRPIPDEHLRRALMSAPPMERAMLALAAYHGLRAGEIAGLQREDILELNDPPVLIVLDGKGGHQRVLPLHPVGWEEIRPWTHGRVDYLFGNTPGEPMKAWAVSHAVNHLLHDLGYESSLHSLRHWYGTKVYQASKDLRVTQALMGHASPNTTVGYVAWSSQDAHEAVGRIGLSKPAGERPGSMTRAGGGQETVDRDRRFLAR